MSWYPQPHNVKLRLTEHLGAVDRNVFSPIDKVPTFPDAVEHPVPEQSP
jgi:hypothetical protein